MTLDRLAKQYNVWVAGDKAPFQRRARILQSMWRDEQGYPAGVHRGELLGSRLPLPWAENNMANFLTENIRSVVRADRCSSDVHDGRLIEPNRLFGNLLGSQPLCFNLFAELALNLDLASRVICQLTQGRFPVVQEIKFEYSPGRSDLAYTGDRSAFDVFLRCQTPAGRSAFLGIEVKYHENLQDRPGRHRERYDEVAQEMDCFEPDAVERLREKPLQQIWRDHLLMGAVKAHDGFADAAFVFLYPRSNTYCEKAVADYIRCLGDASTFVAWTLEEVVTILKQESAAGWIDQFYRRYLDFDRFEGI